MLIMGLCCKGIGKNTKQPLWCFKVGHTIKCTLCTIRIGFICLHSQARLFIVPFHRRSLFFFQFRHNEVLTVLGPNHLCLGFLIFTWPFVSSIKQHVFVMYYRDKVELREEFSLDFLYKESMFSIKLRTN